MPSEKIVAVLFALCALTAFCVAAGKYLMGRKRIDVEVTDNIMPDAASNEIPRCLCGEVATEVMPTIARSRGTLDFLRSIFAAPPRYKRYVDPEGAKALCVVHAHVADSKIDEFIYGRIRGVLAEANAKIALEAASFEKETLPEALKSSLTSTEKRNVGKIVSIQQQRATGTNGSPASG